MNPKQAAFVREYLIDKNGRQAAIRAGYSAKTAESKASQLLRIVKVSRAVALGIEKQVAKAEITADRTLQEIVRLATVDLRGFYDESGNLKPLHTLTPEQGAALAGVETLKRNITAGDGEMETVYKIKLWDKTRALEMLAKHFALLVERVEHSGSISLVETLQAARNRLADAKRSSRV